MKRKIKQLIMLAFALVLLTIAWIFLKDFIFPKVVHSVQKPPKIEFGIVTDSFSIDRNVVQPGENLMSILINYNVDAAQLGMINQKSAGVIDMRKVRAGHSYTAMCANTHDKPLQYFIYEVSDTNYVIFDFRDSLKVTEGKNEIVRQEKVISGVIHNSLWGAMEEAGAGPDLALALSDIFKWSIDFYDIQQGDSFKAYYEDISVKNKHVGIGKIYAADMFHKGKEYTAISFSLNNKTEYYSPDGQSMKKEFLKAPLKFTRISSRFTYKRFHPVLKIFRPHLGVDYAAPRGTPVHTIGNGTVTRAGYAGGGGNMVAVNHINGYATTYMHLSKIAAGVRRGSHVTQGQVIGYVGSTGLATGPHLDFRVYRNGKAFDPLKIVSPQALPLLKKYRPSFDSVCKIYEHNMMFGIKSKEKTGKALKTITMKKVG